MEPSPTDTTLPNSQTTISPRLKAFLENPPSLAEIRAERERRRTDRTDRESPLIRQRCKSLAGFVKEAWPVVEPHTAYVHGWHIDLICAHLEAITYGKLLERGLENRLLINEPPRMMKSWLVSVFWPAWEWTLPQMGSLQYLTTCYADEWVKRDARRMRDLVRSDWYRRLWGDPLGLTPLTRASERSFENGLQGARDGRPFESLTGGGGDRLIIDDPLSVDGANSDAERERATRTFREAMASRVNDPIRSAVVCIHHRLHQADVTGIITDLKLPFVHIMLPMRFEPDRAFVSPLGPEFSDPRTVEGELLFPERFPLAVLKRDRQQMTAYAEAGQWQQRPVLRGGIMFKREWFSLEKAAPAIMRRVRGWDLASTAENTSDQGAWTAGVKVGRSSDGVFWIEDVRRARVTGDGLNKLMRQTAQTDGVGVEQDLPQDPGAGGKVWAQSLVSNLAGFKAYSSPEGKLGGDKEARAEPVAAQAEAGNFRIVAYEADGKTLKPWVHTFLDEIETFPASKFKDQVDALSRAFARLAKAPVAIAGVMMLSSGPRMIPGQ